MPQADSKSPSGQEPLQTNEKILYNYPSFQNVEDDTMDLYEMLVTLWKNKWIVITITLVAALGSIIYVLNMPRIYKAEALLLPPKQKDFYSMNLLDFKVSILDQKGNLIKPELNSENVFRRFKQNLRSRSLQRQFINKNNLMELLALDRTAETPDEAIYKRFAELFKLSEKNGITSLSIDLPEAEISAQWINGFIEFVDKETVSQLVEDTQNSIENQIREIEYNIKSKRLMAERRREDQIIRYTEHAEIAKRLGMLGRVDATNIIQTTEISRDIASATSPLYYLGYEALLTEIEILRNRKSDDPFILGLRDLQEQLAMLQSITLDEKNMSAVQIDQAAFPPKYAIKPNRRLIVSLATVFGLFAGVLLVFFIEFFKGMTKKHSD